MGSDPEVQAPESNISASPPVANTAKPIDLNSAWDPSRSSTRALNAATLFGAMAGMLMGSIDVVACCCLLQFFDQLPLGALIGGTIGALLGGAIGYAERKIRGAFIRPDIATIICTVFGLLPSLLLLAGFGIVINRFSGLLFLGALSAGPMIGLLIGGALDRAYEESLAKSWRAAGTSGLIAVVGCFGIVYALLWITGSPDPEEIGKKAKAMIRWEWKKDVVLRDATINEITLIKKSHNIYAGSMIATIDGESKRFTVGVVLDGKQMNLVLNPIDP